MKRIKLFEDFKLNNKSGSLISEEDVIECIKKSGVIYTTTINNYSDNDPKEPLKPLSVDDNQVTVIIDGSHYTVDIEKIEKIEF